MPPFQGLSAFPITPADEHGRVDTDALRSLVRRLARAGVGSVGLLGSTGSYPYLSRSERRRAVEAAVEEAGAIPILAGVGALRTDDAVQFSRDARDAGAAGGLLAPVSYTPLTDEEVFQHFAAVAGATALPLCIYNNPAATHFTFSTSLIGRLSRVPNVLAVKHPAPGAGLAAAGHQALRGAVRDGFSVGYSVDWNAAEALLAGGEAWYSVAAGLFPEPCLAITNAALAGNAAETRRFHGRLRPLWDLFAAHSSLRVTYAAANLLGLCRAAPPRPILPLPDAVQRQVARTLEELGLR